MGRRKTYGRAAATSVFAASLAMISISVAMAAPGVAMAKKGYFVFDPGHSTEAHARGSHGFVVSLRVSRGQVSLAALGPDASVQYTTRDIGDDETIKARFGSLGGVSLRFHPRGKPRSEQWFDPSCKGGDSLFQPGTFVGKLDFEGEQGYTAIHATRIKGSEVTTKKQVCKESKEGEQSVPLKGAVLQAVSKKGFLSFNAFKTEFKSKPALNGSSFSATMMEFHQQGMSIFRSIQASGDLGAFSISRSHGRLDAALVTPPAPFTGDATYQRAPAADSEAWTGSLAGDFPGLGTVNLTGPEFCAAAALFKSCSGSAAWIVTLG